MSRFTLFFVFLTAWLSAAAAVYDVDRVPNVHVQDRTRYVADPDHYITTVERASLDARLDSIRRATTVEPMIAVVGDIPDDTDIDTYATELFGAWGLGKKDKDNGLLIVVAVEPHKVAIRTGYGLEGVMPDITCGRIIREDLAPAFRRGAYGRGLLAATDRIERILTDPEYAAELRSAQPDADDAGSSQDDRDAFAFYLMCALGLPVVMAICLGISLLNLRGRSDYDKYCALASWRAPMLILGFIGVGIPFVVVIPFILLLNHWRNHARNCPTCGTRMNKVDEVNDNRFLTPSQDLEERIGSVDYDVWLCPKCGETDILPYVQSSSQYVECDRCHARTARLVADRIVRRPTSTAKGLGVKEYECLNCHHRQNRNYDIPRDESGAAAALGAAAILGSTRRGGGGFGGFSGGSFGGGFGGGMTGGGGASGGW